MTKLRSRLLRQLSLANLLAGLALFFALGGIGYAAATINGNAIKQQTIGAGKLKKGTLTSTQVKANALTGSVIDESTLNIVPSAQTAVSAQTATSAKTATTAEEAETLDGFTPEELQVSCPDDTSLYGGMCWDDQVRPLKLWVNAAIECGDDGGRLPTLGELVAYVAQPGTQAADPHWSGDVIDLPSGKEHALTRNETTTGSDVSPAIFGFRCVFYRSN
ncbi:MAG: hypothetical protein QOE75_2229 [Solirubrobacterales bacterium]|jgi:hypothetical protein|nr:hypothetical protein [Solirubrobacterales bacterium]